MTKTQTEIQLEKLEISNEVIKAMRHMGFETLTPIQEKCIPYMMQGTDVIAVAPTGTGKTIAYGIPLLEYVNLNDDRVQEVILAPTRELAQQIAAEIKLLAKYIPAIRMAIIYGGQPIARQISALKRRPQILIATPGRLLDHMGRGNINLSNVHTLVLDEADEMLKMGFVADVSRIIEATNSSRELVMFSATTNQDVMTMSWKYQHSPVEVSVEAVGESKPDIKQYIIASGHGNKFDHLMYLLDSNQYSKSMVFCNTKFMTDNLTKRIKNLGFNAECLHGDMRQSARNAVMTDFRKGRFELLIATDVMARGIDVEDVDAVFNYDLPDKNEFYIHRIGRTGRAHKSGCSFSFVTGLNDEIRMGEILKYIDAKPTRLAFDEFGVLRYEENQEPFFDKY
ncbi:MAG: DEAD/DEAH box helicase [Clostridia bacterium]|nr:DEAD/DEAH box helicase [Clostridia bacterium]